MIFFFTLLDEKIIQKAGTNNMANSPLPKTVPTPTSLLVKKVAKIFTNISGDEEAAAMKVTAEMSGLHSNPKKLK